MNIYHYLMKKKWTIPTSKNLGPQDQNETDIQTL